MNEARNLLLFILSFLVVVVLLTAPYVNAMETKVIYSGIADKSKITELYYEPSTMCLVGWLKDDVLVVHPDFEFIGMPSHVKVEYVLIPSPTPLVRYFKNHCKVKF